MNKISLLDCTLREGGYINDWNFGLETIKGFITKIEKTGIEFFEIGFLKNINYNSNKTIFSNMDEIKTIISPKKNKIKYVAMIDINDKIPIDQIKKNDGTSIDGIRLIFKKNKIQEAYEYSKELKKLGYLLFIQFVSTDTYKEEEFIEGIKLFNELEPYAVSIVDTFGLMKKNMFTKLVTIADKYLNKEIELGYHAHNNLQQAQSNSETLVEMNLNRNI